MIKRFYTNTKKTFYVWLCYLFYFFCRKSSAVRVLIFAQGRTGSTLLENLISSSGSLRTFGELLAKLHSPWGRPLLSPSKYLIGLSNWKKVDLILHVKVYHLTQEQKTDPSEFLKRMEKAGWKIIFLQRENLLEHVLSNLIAERRGSFHQLNKTTDKIKLNIDLKRFARMMHERMTYSKNETEALSSINCLKISYEKDLKYVDAHKATIHSIFDYLKLPYTFQESVYKKINTQPLDQVIENYDEFTHFLTKNNWDNYITDRNS